jgi:hypothetical protein
VLVLRPSVVRHRDRADLAHANYNFHTGRVASEEIGN